MQPLAVFTIKILGEEIFYGSALYQQESWGLVWPMVLGLLIG